MTATSAVPERQVAASDLFAEAEVRKAARALILRPLLYAGAGRDEDLALVRRHRTELSRVFAEGLGYRLVVEPGLARLVKTGLGADSTRGLRRRSGTPFIPCRYALLALTLAALGRARPQLMVDELVAEIRAAAADAGIDVDLDTITDRRALHSALVALVDLGVLSERDGDLDHWVERQTQSLLDVHRDRLALLVAAPLGGCASPEDVLRVAAVPSAAGGARVAVRRRLAEQPVLSVEDLSEEQREWWRRNRNREREWFRRTLGLDLELRAEGAVAIDHDGELTDRSFPGGGSLRHYALLLLEELVNHLRATHGPELAGVTWARVAVSTARQAGDRVFESWRDTFRKAHREDPDGLFEEALHLLAEAGLVRRDPGGVHVHAAGARFAARPALVTSSPAGDRSLFDEEDR